MRTHHFIVIGILVLVSCGIMLASGHSGQPNSAASQESEISETREEACPYVVQKGDTLINVATRLTGKRDNYKVIMGFNDLKSDVILPGTVLFIPIELLLEAYQCQPKTLALPTATPTSSLLPSPSPTPTITPEPTLTPPPDSTTDKIPGEIEGLVFEDVNCNGFSDEDEPGISDVQVVLLKNGDTQITDAQGKFLFQHVSPGEHAIGIYETGFPKECRLSTESTALVSLAEGDRGYVAFGLQCDQK